MGDTLTRFRVLKEDPMPWQEESTMQLRRQFIQDVQSGATPLSELCRSYAISRKTGYKWLARSEAGGLAALTDQSRQPHHSPTATPPDLVAVLLEGRRHHPTWGPRKLLRLLRQQLPRAPWPARSTIALHLQRAGLVVTPRRVRRPGHPGPPQAPMDAPNAIWTADFKGQFRLGNGEYCYPLTIADGCSRFLLSCQGLTSTAVVGSRAVFERAFQAYGLPGRIRSDNGVPFATQALARLSPLSVWWVRLGILPDLIEPASPQQNGRHERMHRTLKHETTRPPCASRAAQQRRFNRWRQEFNTLRPHEALNDATPASVYVPSPRRYPARLPALEYPGHYEARRVSNNGGIRWHCTWVNVSQTLGGEVIGLVEIDDGEWDVYFGPLRLGRFHERTMLIEDAHGRQHRRPY
jgi:transposase InsO family protein